MVPSADAGHIEAGFDAGDAPRLEAKIVPNSMPRAVRRTTLCPREKPGVPAA
jgi:hypothetical protein